jgi:hypothetical protein
LESDFAKEKVLFRLKRFCIKRGSRVKIPHGRATVKRFAICDLRFAIEVQSAIRNPQSAIGRVRKPFAEVF